MLYGIKYVLKYLMGTDSAGRNMAVYPDDTFITSYPRSGNTWTRFLVANLLRPTVPITFANIEDVIPDSITSSSRALKRVSRPRIIKSHEYFDPRYPKVIYLVRDPRDVAISLYNFRRKYRMFDDSYPIEKYIADRFIRGDLDVSWGEHVGSWVGARGSNPNFLLLRYEDLQRDAPTVLHGVAKFLGIDATAAHIATAIERSDSGRMRALEKSQHEKWITTKGHRTDVPFVADAKAGAWRQKLPKSAAVLIESAWTDLIKRLGYDLYDSAPPLSASSNI